MVTGIIFGISPSATEEYKLSDGTNTTDQITTYSGGGLQVGFHGALGLSYTVTNMLSIFGEITTTLQNWVPAEGLVTTYNVNGVDQLNQLPTYQKQTNYVSSGSFNNTYKPGSPDQEPQIHLPFSSVGITIGVIINFTGGGSSK